MYEEEVNSKRENPSGNIGKKIGRRKIQFHAKFTVTSNVTPVIPLQLVYKREQIY